MMKRLSASIPMVMLLIGCEKPAAVSPGGRPAPTVLKEVKVLRLQPEGQSPLSAASLNAMLAEWSEVPLSEFHYESEPNGIIFPYQEGEWVGGDSKPGTWRFYHCAGLRIQSGDGPARYFLPVDSTKTSAPQHPDLNHKGRHLPFAAEVERYLQALSPESHRSKVAGLSLQLPSFANTTASPVVTPIAFAAFPPPQLNVSCGLLQKLLQRQRAGH